MPADNRNGVFGGFCRDAESGGDEGAGADDVERCYSEQAGKVQTA